MRRNGHKYGARKVELDGHVFDSMGEAARYSELVLLQRAGEIEGLELQPRLPLRAHGSPVILATYVADFRYRDTTTGGMVIEDFKGIQTPVFRLKWRWAMVEWGDVYSFILSNKEGKR